MEHALVIAYGAQPRTVYFKDARSTKELIAELRETGFLEVTAPYAIGSTKIELGTLFIGQPFIISVA
ncbi:MAG TPA: hypothetical protein VL418_17805 [Devosiaceae bacterium]|jgi:hypothetical protein|nr:hypothetical protein [Devosiaceae bacterium]